MKKIIIFPLSIVLLFGACQSNKQTEQSEETEKYSLNYSLEKSWSLDSIFLTPESVIYDETRDVLYVTNLNNAPREKDGNGFVSKVSPDGEVLELRWIEDMHAPKGMAIVDNMLYVADIDELIIIDIENASIAEKIMIENAGMINDIAADEEGTVYISDTDSAVIYTYQNGELSTWYEEDLNRPNGLYVMGNTVYLASMGSQDFVSINKATMEKTLIVEGVNAGDGVSYTGEEGLFIVTDWNGEIFLVDSEKGEKVSLLAPKENEVNTADTEFLMDQDLLLVPTFYDNSLVAYKLVKGE